MKKLLLILAFSLGGCTTISNLIPRDHDPVMFDNIVSLKISYEKLNCEDKNWTDAENKIQHLKLYTELRKDPQATSIAQLQQAVEKAKASNNKMFCESVLKINKTRIDVIIDAWKGR